MIDSHVADVAAAYLRRFPEDEARVGMLTLMLESGRSVVGRQRLPGHVTAAAVVQSAPGEVLVVRHKTLDLWLIPGGHVEEDDTTLEQTARRELAEEVGLVLGEEALRQDLPIDLDTHVIPANSPRGEPTHWHFDFRFWYAADAATLSLDASEVSGAEWISVARLSPTLQQRLTP